MFFLHPQHSFSTLFGPRTVIRHDLRTWERPGAANTMLAELGRVLFQKELKQKLLIHIYIYIYVYTYIYLPI